MAKSKPETQTYILLRGMHSEGSRVFSAHGGPKQVQSSHDLVQLFGKSKFARAADYQRVVEDDSAGPKRKSLDANGDDVTAEFEGAAGLGVTIYEKSGWYKIFKDGENEPVNPKGLRKDDVAEKLEDMAAAQ